MATTISKRVSGTITENITKRAPFDGGDASTYDAWGNSWGTHGDSSWGGSWLVKLGLTALGHAARVIGNPAGGLTGRVSETPTGGQTSRLSFLLALEGDESGNLLLEGDAQSGGDALKLEGDETAIGGTITKRVTETVV